MAIYIWAAIPNWRPLKQERKQAGEQRSVGVRIETRRIATRQPQCALQINGRGKARLVGRLRRYS
jgi:hypothetical protein